jgi:hypothetical protein
MISELKDEEILDFLMTSDLDGDYKPEELKYLIIKWRYFYRILHSKYESTKGESELLSQQKETDTDFLQNQINQLLAKIVEKDDIINELKQRKLTLKERIKGKIIHKDEN